MKNGKIPKTYTMEYIEFFAQKGDHLYPIIREIDVYNEQFRNQRDTIGFIATSRRVVLEGESYIRCTYSEHTKVFLDGLIEKYMNGKALQTA